MGASSSNTQSLNSKLFQAILQDSIVGVERIVSEHPHMLIKPVNDNLWSPLILACTNGSFEVVQLLVNVYDADIDYQDYNGFTALLHVVYKNEKALVDVANFLCMKGANIEIKTDTGISAYSISLANNSKTYQNLLEYHMKYGYWAKHPFSQRKKLLWIYKQSEYKRLPISLIKEICFYM